MLDNKQVKRLTRNAVQKVIHLGFQGKTISGEIIDYRNMYDNIKVDITEFVETELKSGTQPVYITMKAARAWLDGSIYDTIWGDNG